MSKKKYDISHFDRVYEIETLQEIIENREYYKENSSRGISIIINGEWGSGKTTFIEDFKKTIEKEYNVLNIFNSFEYDFYNSAYIPVFSHIEEQLKTKIDLERLFSATSNQITKEFLSVSYTITKSIFKNKLGIDLDDARDAALSIYDNYQQKNSEFEKYRELKKIKKEIKEKISHKAKDKPIIFIIDELDRCNPYFAISTLEIIKYFLDIDNFIIILSLDKKQLEESVKTIYGNGMNSDIYFSKFFDYQFNLNKLDFVDLIKYNENTKIPDMIDPMNEIFSIMNVSIRDSYKIFNEFVSKHEKFNGLDYSWNKSQCIFILFMITIKNIDLMFYNSIVYDNFDYFKKYALKDDIIENKKYQKMLSYNSDLPYSIEGIITLLLRYKDKNYGEIKYMQMMSSSIEQNKDRELMNKMFAFLPHVMDGGTYLENLLKILQN